MLIKLINNIYNSIFSNEDLLTILIKTGSKGISASDIAVQVLNKIENITNLKDINIHTFDKIKGLGIVKKIELLVAIELGKRIYLKNNLKKKIKYTDPNIIYHDNKYIFYGLKQENFYVLYLDSKKQLIERKLLFMGTIDSSVVHPREVFKNAYLCSAASFICLHNHPSGDVIPSKADMEITKTLLEIGRIQGIDLVDHLVVSDLNYFSFYENNLLR